MHVCPPPPTSAQSAPWLQTLTAEFVARARSRTRQGALRTKDWLHLSLAYEFRPEDSEALATLAREMVDPRADAGWELRLYERHPDRSWMCHASWPVD